MTESFASLLDEQRGLFTRQQATAHGISESTVRANVRARRWRHLGRDVFAGFTGPLHDRHRLWFGVLAVGDGACLSHETAAHRHGLLAAAPDRVHVLVAHARRIEPIRGIHLHRSRSSRRTAGSPATTAVADTLCDLSAGGWQQRRIAGVVATATQRRLTTPDDLVTAIGSRGPFPGVSTLRALAQDTEEGAESALELRFLRDVERAHGLPRAARQARVRRRDGSIAVRDVHYARWNVTVELDGKEFHGSMEARLRDGRRDRLAAEVGELTLRCGWLDVTSSPCLVAREVAGALIERDWSGRVRACPDCP